MSCLQVTCAHGCERGSISGQRGRFRVYTLLSNKLISIHDMRFVPSCTGGAMPGSAGAHRRQVRGQLSAHAASMVSVTMVLMNAFRACDESHWIRQYEYSIL